MANFITFPCSQCYREMFANEHFIGITIACPQCGFEESVPESSIPFTREQEKLREEFKKKYQSRRRKSSHHQGSNKKDDSKKQSQEHSSRDREYKHRQEQKNQSHRQDSAPFVKDEKYYGNVLNLKGRVTFTDVKKNYRELSAQYHPDKVHHLGHKLKILAEEEFKEINTAFDFFKQRYKT